jgi:CheY-like chemotaxis protein
MTPLVLVVDNEMGLLLLFGSLVRRMGYQVLQANSGTAALDLLEQQTPDLMVLDLAMPEMTGYDVLRQVMTMPRLDKMPVMVLTATNLGPAPEDVAHRIGAWVTKPVRPEIYEATVRELLEGAEHE